MVTDIDVGDVVDLRVQKTLTVQGVQTGVARSLRLSGVAHLAPGIDVGAMHTLNGDKLLDLIEPIVVTAGEPLSLEINYVQGGGLSTFRCVTTGDRE